MKKMILLVACATTLVFCSCSKDDDVKTPVTPDPVEEQKPDVKPDNEVATTHYYNPLNFSIPASIEINKRMQRFGWQFFKTAYANREKAEDMMISPVSLQIDMGMLLNGIKDGSRQQLLKTLGLEDFTMEQINFYFKTLLEGIANADPAVKYTAANSAWMNHNWTADTDFISTLKDYYQAEVKSVDFTNPATVGQINDWCSEHTQGKIDKLLEKTSENDIAYLINAVYFKAPWAKKFSEGMTSAEPFHYADGTVEDVDMMDQLVLHTLYAENERFQVMSLDFIDSSFRLLLMLPRKGVELADAIPATFGTEELAAMERKNVSLSLPKFTTEYTQKKVKKLLQEMNPGFDILNTDVTFVKEFIPEMGWSVTQKTFIKVNEEGAEAAAVTSTGVEVTSVPQEEAVMKLDRPFFYSIVEATSGCPLFIGYYGR